MLALDLDGVLHDREGHFAIEDVTTASASALRAAGLFKHCELLHRELAPYPDVQIVIHSSWRATLSKERLRKLVGPLGERLVAVAPPQIQSREIALLELARARHWHHDQLVILDDQPELFATLRGRVIECPPEGGLSSPVVLAKLRLALQGSR